eukprot:83011-Chlamydomonas_euryale.AAC.4
MGPAGRGRLGAKTIVVQVTMGPAKRGAGMWREGRLSCSATVAEAPALSQQKSTLHPGVRMRWMLHVWKCG